MKKRSFPVLKALACSLWLATLLAGCIPPLQKAYSNNVSSSEATQPAGIHFPKVTTASWIKSVTKLCLQVEQSYVGVSGHNEPIAEDLQGIFERIGVQVISGSSPDCQASLNIKIEFTPVTTHVSGIGGGECYLDVASSGQASLSAKGHITLKLPLEVLKPSNTGSGIRMVYSCPKSPGEAPFGSAWGSPVAAMLAEWWGSPALVSALQAKTHPLQFAAQNQLPSMGAEAIPVLIDMLQDADPEMRTQAANALGAFGPAATQAVPGLIQAINDSDTSTRYAAVDALGKIGDSQAIAALITALHHGDSYIRYLAAQTLAKQGSKASAAVPDLINEIDDDFDQAGTAAVDALGAIGLEAKAAIPRLITQLETTDSYHQSNALNALKKITGQDFGKDATAWKQWFQSQK